MLASLFLMNTIFAMKPAPHQIVDANGYRYRDESTVGDKRKIAILSYGSLVKQRENLQTRARLETRTEFAQTQVQLPVSLARVSRDNRITAVIDKDGDPKRVWAAESKYTFLPNARNNLAAREGSPYRGQDTGYDLTNIFYMKKLLPSRMKDSNEEVVPGTQNWVIRTAANERQQLPMNVAQKVAKWADDSSYTAVIWASFPPNISSREQVIQKLLADDTLLRNTQEYVRNLPDGAQSTFERAIIAGKDALRALLAGAAGQIPAVQAPVLPAQHRAAQNIPAEDRQYQNFTFYQHGNAPILLTAPHGGEKRSLILKTVRVVA